MVISQNSHCQFSLHSCDISVRDNGFPDFHILLPRSPLILANKTKRELVDCYTRHRYLMHILKKFGNDCVSRTGCRINTTEPNPMILVSFFSEDNVLSDEIVWWNQNMLYFRISKKRKSSIPLFGGHPVELQVELMYKCIAANLSFKKKVLLSLKKHIWGEKKYFCARSAHHEREARSPFGQGLGPA